jgi:5'-methylthioadenosine phosphorylase
VTPRAELGVFGGSGFYSFLEDVEEVEVETPYGKPSAPFTIGEVGGRRVAFLPRHGLRHELPPPAIPYRANVWAPGHLGSRSKGPHLTRDAQVAAG